MGCTGVGTPQVQAAADTSKQRRGPVSCSEVGFVGTSADWPMTAWGAVLAPAPAPSSSSPQNKATAGERTTPTQHLDRGHLDLQTLPTAHPGGCRLTRSIPFQAAQHQAPCCMSNTLVTSLVRRQQRTPIAKEHCSRPRGVVPMCRQGDVIRTCWLCVAPPRGLPPLIRTHLQQASLPVWGAGAS